MAPEKIIVITYIKYNNFIESIHWKKKFEKLPEVIKEKCNKYVRMQDKHSCFIGKLLLVDGLMHLGVSNDMLLNDWRIDEYGRPYINKKINFNISHTEGFVVCAVSMDTVRLGIDIEKVKPVNIYDFALVLGDKVIDEISISMYPYELFYKYWTATESSLKADGRGFSIDMKNIDINFNSNVAIIEDNIWYITEVSLDSGFVCYISASYKNIQLKLHRYIDCC